MHNLSACIGYLWLVCALILYVCFGRLKPQFVLSLKKSVHQESEGRGGGVGRDRGGEGGVEGCHVRYNKKKMTQTQHLIPRL